MSLDLTRSPQPMPSLNAIMQAALRIGATPADIPGLWNAPGYPELTTGQLLDIASKLPPQS